MIEHAYVLSETRRITLMVSNRCGDSFLFLVPLPVADHLDPEAFATLLKRWVEDRTLCFCLDDACEVLRLFNERIIP